MHVAGYNISTTTQTSDTPGEVHRSHATETSDTITWKAHAPSAQFQLYLLIMHEKLWNKMH